MRHRLDFVGFFDPASETIGGTIRFVRERTVPAVLRAEGSIGKNPPAMTGQVGPVAGRNLTLTDSGKTPIFGLVTGHFDPIFSLILLQYSDIFTLTPG
jgi:hypothetical protein